MRKERMDIWECVRQNAPILIKELIEREVDVDERNDNGETALHLAATYGYVEVIQVLLVYGANIYLKDWESGWTALHRSVYHKQWMCTLLLLRHVQLVNGRNAIKECLYTIRDASQQSVMEMLSSFTREKEETQEKCGGMVYTFGKVDFQLGYHLPHVLVQSSPRVVELPSTATILQISANKFHTVALNACGMVYVWGFGKGGRLGTGTEYDCIQPVLLKSLEGIPMAQVAAGENHTLALSCSGQVFSWGSNRFGQLGHVLKTTTLLSRCVPKRIESLRGMNMTHIAASGSHSAAIGHGNCSVYTWGSNKRGQLGRKEGFGSDQAFPIPKSVDRLRSGHALSVLHGLYESITAVDLSMSDFHTCVLLKVVKNGQRQGQVWQFGGGSDVPSRISFPTSSSTSRTMNESAWQPHWRMEQERNDIIAVSCARNHSIALSATGAVFTWGHNGDALSHDQRATSSIPGSPQRVVAMDKYARVVSICASQDHCAVVTRDGDLVTWGCGPQGVLGHGSGTSWQPQPKRVEGAKKVVAVAAGHQHTVLLVAPEIPVYPQKSKGTVAKLQALVQERIAEWVDITNVATVWKYANVHAQETLERYCMEFMEKNGDALLEMGSKERFDVLLDLVLPPPMCIQRPMKSVGIENEPLVVPLSVTKSDEPISEKPVSMKIDEEDSKAATIVAPSETSSKSDLPVSPPVTRKSHELTRKKSNTKFVPLDVFFADKKAETNTFKPATDVSSRWKTIPTPVVAPTPLPLMVPKKVVGGHTAKPGADPTTRDQPTGSTFSLDVFIVTKKPQRKKSRSDSMDQPSVVPLTPWVSTVPAVQTKATMKQIQEEEEAKARAEAAAKAKHGGCVRKMSTINSWGHVEPVYESLADLQKREEEERMIEQQRQILAQIQLEHERRVMEEVEKKNTNNRVKNKKKTIMNKENMERQGKENIMSLGTQKKESRTTRREKKQKNVQSEGSQLSETKTSKRKKSTIKEKVFTNKTTT